MFFLAMLCFGAEDNPVRYKSNNFVANQFGPEKVFAWTMIVKPYKQRSFM